MRQVSLGKEEDNRNFAIELSRVKPAPERLFAYSGRVVLVVADGAGGTGRGAHAADATVRLVKERSDAGVLDVLELLRDCDLNLAREAAGGETTAVVAVVDEKGVAGASVGDSGAWLVEPSRHVDLTQHQVRKPLVGSGQAVPIPFGCGPLTATLLLGTDGLFKYGDAARIRKIATTEDLDSTPGRLIESVRLRSGALQDDTTVLICHRL